MAGDQKGSVVSTVLEVGKVAESRATPESRSSRAIRVDSVPDGATPNYPGIILEQLITYLFMYFTNSESSIIVFTKEERL